MNNYIEQFKNGQIIVINNNSVKLQYKLKYNSPVTKTIGVSITYRFNEDEDWKTEVKYTTWKNKEISQFFQLPISTSNKVYLKNLASTGYLYDLNIISEDVQATEIDLDEDTYIYNTSIDTNTQNNSSYASQDWVEEQIGQIDYIAPTIVSMMPIVNNIETISSKVSDINDNLVTREEIINIIDNYIATKNRTTISGNFIEEISEESEQPNIEFDENNHFAVDLGLPSHTKWATCNIYANKEYTPGALFQYGENEPFYTMETDNYDDLYNFNKNITINWKEGKEDGYTQSNNKYYNPSTKKYTKYNSTDNIKKLDSEDDPATHLWGSNWETPSKEQWEELINKCKWECNYDFDVYVWKITGPNGNFIYLPFVSDIYGKNIKYIPYGTMHECIYMSNNLNEDTTCECYDILYYHENGINCLISSSIPEDESLRIIESRGHMFGTGTDGVTGEIVGYEVDYDENGNEIELDLGTDQNGKKIRRIISTGDAIKKYLNAVTKNKKYIEGNVIIFRNYYIYNGQERYSDEKYICMGRNTKFIAPIKINPETGEEILDPITGKPLTDWENGHEEFVNYIWRKYDRLELQISCAYRYFGTHVRPVLKSGATISSVINNDGSAPYQYITNIKYPSNMILLDKFDSDQNYISTTTWYNHRANNATTDPDEYKWWTVDQFETIFGLTKKDLLCLSLGIYNSIKLHSGEIFYVESVWGNFLNYDCLIKFHPQRILYYNLQEPRLQWMSCIIFNRWNREQNREEITMTVG